MKGFAMQGIGNVGWVEKDRPSAGSYDAVLRPLALAPCSSDIHNVYEGAIGDRKGVILGHEAVGEVVEVGDQVKDFKPGDRVIVPAITPNWRTINTQRGYSQHCDGFAMSAFKFTNERDGVFADYFLVNDADMNLAILPEEISLEKAVMIGDMLTTGFHGAELADIKPGVTVAVIGIGPVGLMAVAGAEKLGAGRIIAVGSRKACVEVAKYYGANDIVNYKNGSIVSQIKEITKGKGVDSVIIAGGEADIIKTAIRITKPGGTVSNINFFGAGDELPIPRFAWGCGLSHINIRGGICPGGRLRMELMAELVKYNRVDPSKIVSHVFHGLENIEKAFELMRDKSEDLVKPIVIV